jgi:hypothetical protein
MAAWMLPAAIIGSSLFAAESSSDAADTAAQASRQASDASVGEQRRQFDLSRSDYQPFLTAGTGAVNRLAAGMAPVASLAEILLPKTSWQTKIRGMRSVCPRA